MVVELTDLVVCNPLLSPSNFSESQGIIIALSFFTLIKRRNNMQNELDR